MRPARRDPYRQRRPARFDRHPWLVIPDCVVQTGMPAAWRYSLAVSRGTPVPRSTHRSVHPSWATATTAAVCLHPRGAYQIRKEAEGRRRTVQSRLRHEPLFVWCSAEMTPCDRCRTTTCLSRGGRTSPRQSRGKLGKRRGGLSHGDLAFRDRTGRRCCIERELVRRGIEGCEEPSTRRVARPARSKSPGLRMAMMASLPARDTTDSLTLPRSK
jgi:hypothetical protein